MACASETVPHAVASTARATTAWHRVRDVADASDVLRLRTLCRVVLRAIGEVRVHRHELQSSVFLSAEMASNRGEDLAQRASIPFAQTPVGLNDLNTAEVQAPVRLSRAMQRYLALLRRLRRSLPRGPGAGQRRSTLTLAEALQKLVNGVQSGRVATATRFLQLARAALQDALLAGWEEAEHLEEGHGEAKFAAIVQQFEADLLLVEVPEVECASFEVPDVRRPAVRIDVDISMICERRGRERPVLQQRWLWVELVVLDEEDVEMDCAPRVRLHDAHIEPTRTSSSGDILRVTFSHKLLCSPSECAAAQFLWAAGGRARHLRVSVFADWPVLQNYQTEIYKCHVVITDLCPNT